MRMCAQFVQCSHRIMAMEVAAIMITSNNDNGNNDIQSFCKDLDLETCR